MTRAAERWRFHTVSKKYLKKAMRIARYDSLTRPVTEGMGMTWITAAEALTHPGSVGKAIWGDVHVCGDDGEEPGARGPQSGPAILGAKIGQS